MYNTFFLVALSSLKLAVILVISGLVPIAWSAPQQNTAIVTEQLNVALYQSDILALKKNPRRVSVANPEIADIVLLPHEQVHIVGKALGTTNVVFWDSAETIYQTVNIVVTHDLLALKNKLYTMMPEEPIQVFSAQDKLILKGQVSSASNASAAMKVAEGYIPECRESGGQSAATQVTAANSEQVASGRGSCGQAEVVNLMTVVGSQQIMLEVKVAEISRTFLRTLDTDLNVLDFSPERRFGAVNGGASWPNVLVNNNEVPYIPAGVPNGEQPVIGPMVDKFDPNAHVISDKGLFFQDLAGDTFFQAALELSRSKGLAKVLAEPTLTTLTGRSAEFLSGGEFPVPVPEDGRTSIQFKDFGVKVKFLPTILEQGRISLDLDIAVTELSQSQPVDIGTVGSSGVFVIPSLSKRGVTSTVELANGQTIGIAGLIQDNVREVMTRLPGIGDLPVIGHLFRSQEFVSGQTELVIFVTASLAKPIAKDKIRLPTDSFVPPSDLEFYLLGKMEGRHDAKNSQTGDGTTRPDAPGGSRETVGNASENASPQPASILVGGPGEARPSGLITGLTGGVEGLSFGHDL